MEVVVNNFILNKVGSSALAKEPIQIPRNFIEYHRELSHPNMVLTRDTAKQMVVKLEGTRTFCKAFAIAVAKKKKVSE